jgi:hypothetical protein
LRTLVIQLQPARSPDLDETRTIAMLRSLAGPRDRVTVTRDNDDGPYVNVSIETTDPTSLWTRIRATLLENAEPPSPAFARCAIVTCEGKHGWSDYLLLHHFHSAERPDDLSSPT